MILVAGIGNIFFGDDAFGSEVARRMAPRFMSGDVRVVDFNIRGLDLAFALMDEYDRIVIVDATRRGGAPGTIYVIEPDLNELDAKAGSSFSSTLTVDVTELTALRSTTATLWVARHHTGRPRVTELPCP